MSDPKIETDVAYIIRTSREVPPYHDEVGRIRREFLSAAVLNVLTGSMPSGTLQSDAWDVGEELLREGIRRGYLP